ncbi:UDP-3-O-[3-hydroxymyristoyl] N-acetylglucosamine deacetylase [bacterium]|nr:UDP-3-O-[3-hydroxymyristoyl] N-acetylglucosamine deacetylase [bacterium]
MTKQTTIAKETKISGIGLHSGEITSLRFLPAPAGTGIVFKRTDVPIPGGVAFPARVTSVLNTDRSTTIGKLLQIPQSPQPVPIVVLTVEHLMASIYCLGIDNLIVEATAMETPLMDGSGIEFAETLKEAGIKELEEDRLPDIVIDEPIKVEHGDATIEILPCDEYKISYTMSYPHPVVGTQFFETTVNEENFINNIAPSRTFALYSELAALLSRGLIKGGSLNNAIVITDNAILSKDGLRYKDEFVRHKVMDLIGDLALVGRRLRAHVVSSRSGHTLNNKAAAAIAAKYANN